MKKQVNIKLLIIIFVSGYFTAGALFLGVKNVDSLDLVDINFQISNGTVHAPINITGNENFTLANGVSSGAGTFEDPFIIRDLIIEIDGPNDCIFISNTNKYFKIQDCILKNSAVGKTAIKLNNVSNGEIFNNRISLAGIFLFSSHNNTISNNNLLDCNEIYIGFSNDNSIINNYIKNSTIGLKLISSNNNLIEANEIYDCRDNGIEISFASNDTRIINNYIYNNGGKTGQDQIDIDFDCVGTIIYGNIYAYRTIDAEFPWLLLIIIIITISVVIVLIAFIFQYRKHREKKEFKHPEPPEPNKPTDQE